jgi:hypothetical protein
LAWLNALSLFCRSRMSVALFEGLREHVSRLKAEIGWQGKPS